MERDIRSQKRRLLALEEAKKDAKDEATKLSLQEEFGKQSLKLKEKERKLSSFISQTNFSEERARTQVAGFGKSISTKAVSAAKNTEKGFTIGGNGGIIKTQGGKSMRINNIDSPIEQRNTGKGNPNAVLQFGRPLNNRQQKILEALPSYDSKIIVNKKDINMHDLSALTAHTGDEFALFTKGNERLVVRGDKGSVNIDIDQAIELSAQGYKWSGHTHPGTGKNCLQASLGDKAILKCFKQKVAYIYNSQGEYLEFWKE